MQNLFLLKCTNHIVVVIVAVYLFRAGIKLLKNQNETNSSMEVEFLAGHFKINSPNIGLILCFLGFVLIVLQFLIF